MTERWARRQFRAGARSALAILLMAPLAAPPSLEAQTPEHGGLRSAIQVYESGDFPRAMQLMEAIQPSALSTRDQAIRDLFRGFIFLAYGDETQAEGAMESAVRLDASVRPDPALHSPSRLEFFERVRRRWMDMRATVPMAAASERGTVLGIGFGPEQFAPVPAGTFRMGSRNSVSDERPVHTVNITRAFYMQKTEVTQGQWREVMGTNPSRFSACGDICPVERVSWNDIRSFLAALNAMDPGKDYRLPTEAEWEYAARAETTGDYGGTGVLEEMAWYVGNSGNKTHPVAQKEPNAWGLFDMHGNVWEWVNDWYSGTYYSVSPTNDPPGPASGSTRVLRGGSWNLGANYARSAHRNYYYPSYRYNFVGFRLARIH